MFLYIGGILAGFAIGYVVAIARNRVCTTQNRTAYKKGVNDCRNCKYLEYISGCGTVHCEKLYSLIGLPLSCEKYCRINRMECETKRKECESVKHG